MMSQVTGRPWTKWGEAGLAAGTPGSGPEQGRNPEKPVRPACGRLFSPPAGLSLGTWGLGAGPLPAPLSGKGWSLGPEWCLCLARRQTHLIGTDA